MILGMFVFSIPTATYQSLQRSTNWRHANNSRFGVAPASQYIGPGEDTITLEGSIVPEYGTQLSLTALRLMGNTGKSFPLISGTGRIYGLWRIDSVDETQTHFHKDGLAKKVEFSLKISKTKSSANLISSLKDAVMGQLF